MGAVSAASASKAFLADGSAAPGTLCTAALKTVSRCVYAFADARDAMTALCASHRLAENLRIRGGIHTIGTGSAVNSNRYDYRGHDMISQKNNKEKKTPGKLSNLELVRESILEASHLARKQTDLAKSELRADVKTGILIAALSSSAGVFAFIGTIIIIMAGVFALSLVLPAWFASLLVGAFFFLLAGIAAIFVWRRRISAPFARTAESIESDLRLLRRDEQ